MHKYRRNKENLICLAHVVNDKWMTAQQISGPSSCQSHSHTRLLVRQSKELCQTHTDTESLSLKAVSTSE